MQSDGEKRIEDFLWEDWLWHNGNEGPAFVCKALWNI